MKRIKNNETNYRNKRKEKLKGREKKYKMCLMNILK
jgi:hypothetical protein